MNLKPICLYCFSNISSNSCSVADTPAAAAVMTEVPFSKRGRQQELQCLDSWQVTFLTQLYQWLNSRTIVYVVGVFVHRVAFQVGQRELRWLHSLESIRQPAHLLRVKDPARLVPPGRITWSDRGLRALPAVRFPSRKLSVVLWVHVPAGVNTDATLRWKR